MKARPLDGQMSCDWKRTVAFAPYGQLCGNIFLNPDAVGGGAAAVERVATELVEMLADARDPETGARLFADVYTAAERFGVDPAEHAMPDVFAISADGYQAQAKWSERHRNTLLRPDYELPATHWAEGVVAIDGPGVAPGARLAAELHDLAPTTLAMLGCAVPAHMEGRILHEALGEACPDEAGAPAVFA